MMTRPATPPKRHIRVAAVQWQPGPDTDTNLVQMARHIEQAAGSGVDLVVFPEYSSAHAPGPGRQWTKSHTAPNGPFVAQLTHLAATHEVTVVAGMLETSDSEKPFNTQVVVGPHGLVATARKIHLYDAFSMRESDLFNPAPPSTPQLVDINGLRVGVQTCYDLRFPEVTRHLVDAGAEVVLIPAQWVPGPHKIDQWLTLATARAIEGQVWVVAADHPSPTGVGNSVIVNPRGEVVSRAGLDEEIITATIDGDLTDAVREENPMSAARRFQVTWG